jgi:tRNA(fMet)-specific endonuclease VapC
VSLDYLLDTNIVSFMLRGRAPAAVSRLGAVKRDRVGISIITAMEFGFGVAKNPTPKLKHVVWEFLDTMPIVPLDAAIVSVYGEARNGLEAKGTPLGPLDTIIAAHALALGATLVTNNTREFRRVKGLRCEDWSIVSGENG